MPTPSGGVKSDHPEDCEPVQTPTLRRLPRNREQMRTHPEQSRLALEPLRQSDHVGTLTRIGPPGIEVGEHARRTFQPEQPFHTEPRLRHLGAQLFGPMKVRGGEVPWPLRGIAMLAVVNFLLDD